MKHTYIWIIALLFVSVICAFAAKPELPRDLTGQKIQGFAPDGTKNVTLSVVSSTTDMSNDLAWESYTPTACKFRLQSTATKTGSTLTLPANARVERRVNSKTPFLNMTGCTSGELQRQ